MPGTKCAGSKAACPILAKTASVIRIQHDSANEQVSRSASSSRVALRTNPNRLKRLVNLLLSDRLSALHAPHESIDFVALLREGRVVLISFAGLVLCCLGGML